MKEREEDFTKEGESLRCEVAENSGSGREMTRAKRESS